LNLSALHPRSISGSRFRAALGPLGAYATLLAGSSFGRLVSFATSILLARHLAPSAFGEFSIFFGVVLVVAELTSFVDFTYVRYANTDANERAAYLGAALRLKNVALLGIAILAVPVGWALAQIFATPALVWMLALGIVTGGLLNVLSLQLADYLADERFLRLTLFNTIYSVLVLIGLSVVVAVEGTPGRIAIAVSFVVPAAAVAAACYLKLRRAAGAAARNRKHVSSMLAFGKWLAAGNVAYLVGQRMDLFIVSAFANLSAVGNYGAALRIAVVASIMTGALPALLLPRASRTVGSREATGSFLRHAFAVSFLILAVTVPLWLATPFVVRHLLGPEYESAIGLARIMLGGAVFAGFSTSISQIFLADERPRRAFYLRLIKAAALLVLAVPAAARFGSLGVAWSVFIAELLAMAYVLYSIRRLLGWKAAIR
jgi:O-antigen/teichoic acid export membrane protein